MYEQRTQELIPRSRFLSRLIFHVSLAILIVLASLGLGIIGYRQTEGLSWIDSLLNAAMILGGMGPVNQLQTTSGKFFASFYAIFSGIIFLVSAGVILAPVFHRILHYFHLETDSRISEQEDN
ncbi:MAG: hypothetical protein OEY18_04785 [Candidatus Aminicenantes bacterium]|nr:hypothetical protein [Candidatus Aminicenantes bacterium]MDH5384005.1 hypothetical protein [Candidatus Aminicenantes bacterium]MDH5745320.1 hypothetical protein [Candidatus Aminicenantes bacterium]